MSSVVAVIVVSLLLGALAKRLRTFPPETAAVVNALVIDVTLPALVLEAMHRVPLTGSLFAAAGVIWLVFVGAAVLAFLLLRARLVDRRTAACLVLTAGLGNTAFVGFAVVEAAFGTHALGVAVFVDQLGSFLAMSVLGLAVAAAASGRTVALRTVLVRIALFPPFVALVIALLLRPFPYPPWLTLVLERFGAMVTPLALFSVGFQLELRGLRERVTPLGAGLLYKLVLAPALAAAVLAWLAPVRSPVWAVTVLQAGMPPMVTGGIIASQHELDPPLAAAMVGLGLVVSALTLTALIALVR